MNAPKHIAQARSGIALLMVLVAVLLAGLALGTLSRQHMERVRGSHLADDQLQRDWLERSASEALAGQIPNLFNGEAVDAAYSTIEPSPVREWAIPVSDEAGDVLRVTAGNESAKLHLPTLLQERTGRQDAVAGVATALKVAPNRITATEGSVANWGQLLDGATALEILSWTHSATLWGQGQIDARHASDSVLTAALAGELTRSELARFLSERQANPNGSFGAWIRIAFSDSDESEQPRFQILTDRSTTYSLMIDHGNSALFEVFDGNGDDRIYRQRLEKP